jgi:hypothetical protein
MKNKTFYLTLLMLTSLIFVSCAGSRGARKGYGCPSTAQLQTPTVEKNKI